MPLAAGRGEAGAHMGEIYFQRYIDGSRQQFTSWLANRILFFSFDGIDGAGKSTQLALFHQWLRQQGHDVVVCRDPGTTQLGEAVREILLSATYRIDYRAEMLLYMACRAQLVQEVIRPALATGKTVISDRFVLANVVYQGCAGDVAAEEIWCVGKIATQALLPNLTFVLDLDPAEAARRLPERRDRMEQRGADYFTDVRRGFLQEAARFPDSNVVINAALDIDEIQRQIQQAALQVFEPETRPEASQ